MTERPFFRITDPDDPVQVDQLLALADLDAEDMGAVRQTFRAWPGARMWLFLLGLMLLSLLPLLIPGEVGWGLTVTLLICIGASGLVLVIAGAVDRHRVCEKGLLLGWRGRTRDIVPWSTVDPGRVRVVERAGLLGRRHDTPASSPHFRTGLLVTRALSVNGIDSAHGGWVGIPGLLGVTDPVAPGARARSTIFVNWLLGTPDPVRLARAIEDAMVAEGYPARGLADAAASRAVVLSWNPDQDSAHPLPYRASTDGTTRP